MDEPLRLGVSDKNLVLARGYDVELLAIAYRIVGCLTQALAVVAAEDVYAAILGCIVVIAQRTVDARTAVARAYQIDTIADNHGVGAVLIVVVLVTCSEQGEPRQHNCQS